MLPRYSLLLFGFRVHFGATAQPTRNVDTAQTRDPIDLVEPLGHLLKRNPGRRSGRTTSYDPDLSDDDCKFNCDVVSLPFFLLLLPSLQPFVDVHQSLCDEF